MDTTIVNREWSKMSDEEIKRVLKAAISKHDHLPKEQIGPAAQEESGYPYSISVAKAEKGRMRMTMGQAFSPRGKVLSL